MGIECSSTPAIY